MADQDGALRALPLAERASLYDLIMWARHEWRVVLGIWVVGSLCAVAAVLMLPRYFVASAVLMVPQQQGQVSGALAQLSALAGAAGANHAVRAPEDLYLSLLRLRTLRDALIQKFDLKARYDQPTLMDARARLDALVNLSADKKSGLVTVSVQDRDARAAANLANAHVDELRRLLGELAVSEAQQRRAFFDQQVDKTRDALRVAEREFRQAQDREGFVVSEALAEAGVRAGVELRTQIAVREVQLRALGRFATPRNPDVQRLAAEVDSLRAQLQQVEQGRESRASEAHAGSSAALDAFRKLKVQQATLESLVKQAEIARMDEAREGPSMQIVELAVPPERPTKPPRTLIVAASSLAFLVLGLLASFFKLSWRTNRPA